MKKFEVLEHRADLKIKVFGQDLAELFINAASAIAEQQNPKAKKTTEEWESVEINSPDLNSLLVDWLNEILSRSDLNHKIYFNFKIEELSEKHCRAKIAGQKVVQKEIDIKAATYHGLEVKKVDEHWQAIIIFDT
ncbi:MAG: archease [Candidatus Portnoybacteria bacterium]|nr:archease [Candidatus Portnoybacteria bacterium]